MIAHSPEPDLSVSRRVQSASQGFERAVQMVVDRRMRDIPDDVRLRIAGKDEIAALRQLNAQTILEMGREGLLMPTSEAFLREMIDNGAVLILESDGKPAGYSICIPVGPGRSPFMDTEVPERAGLIFGTALAGDIRSQGWHKRLIRIRLEIFAQAGFAEVQSTVSPYNIPSLRNLLSSGFRVLGMKVLLDGYPRFLLRHQFGQSDPDGWKQSVALPRSGDLSRHAALLEQGFVGTEVMKGSPSALIYRACPAVQGRPKG